MEAQLDAQPSAVNDRPSPAEIRQIRDFVNLLVKTVHTLLLYPPTNPLPEQFREQFFKAAQAVVHAHPSLLLATTARGFRFHGDVVFEGELSDTNPAAVLFRDGVREIGLVSTLTAEEANALLDVFAAALSRSAEAVDVANALWELGARSVYYRTIDHVEDGDLGSALDGSAYERLSRLFFSTVDSGRRESAAGTRDEAANPHGYEGVQKDRYLHICNLLHGEIEIGAREAREVMELLVRDAEADCAADAFCIYDEILHGEAGGRMMFEVVEITKRQFDGMIQQQSWSAIPRLLGNVRTWMADFADQPAILEALREVLYRAGDKTVLGAMATYLNEHPQTDLGTFREILAALDSSSLGGVTALLGDLEHHAARKVVYSFLGERANEALDLVGNYIYDRRWFVVRNVALVLGRVNRPRAVTFLRKAAAHADVRVRLEAVRSLGTLQCAEADEVLASMIDDADVNLRLHVLKAIGASQSPAVFEALDKRVQDPELAGAPARIQKEVLAAYARAGGARSLPFLLSLINKRRLFGKSRWEKLRVYAVYALGDLESASASEVLRNIAQGKDASLSAAATQVLERPPRPADEEGAAVSEADS